MSIVRVRNVMIDGLADYLQLPVRLANQTVPESEYPYMYYQAVVPYIPRAGVNILREAISSEEPPFSTDVLTHRVELADATYSFTACSRNRWVSEEPHETEESESQESADEAHEGVIGEDWTEEPMDETDEIEVIFGEDEALALAEKAQGWFLHVGAHFLRGHGIEIVEVFNVADRSSIEIDEMDRRWGFDIRIRYKRVDTRRDPAIDNGTITKE